MAIKSSVLISCGGKWVGTALQMRQAMNEVADLISGSLVIGDSAAVTPAAHFADRSVRLPRVDDNQYIPSLLESCLAEDVRVVIPLIDPDLRQLTHHLAEFASNGVAVVCPPPELVDAMLDKVEFEHFANKHGLPCVATVPAEQLPATTYPLFAKRRSGSGSVGTHICSNFTDAAALAADPELIFQPFVAADEYSVDCFVNDVGQCTVRVPRSRTKVTAGEAYISVTGAPQPVIELADAAVTMLAAAGLRGPLNVQIFAANPPVLLEINPRLGSACVLSNVATSGRLFRSILATACGESVDGEPDDFIAGVEMIRYPGEIHHLDGTVLASFPQPPND